MFDQPLFEKEIRFFKVNPQKKQDLPKSTKKSIEFIDSEERRIHEIIRQVLKDFQYFLGYKKEQLNLSEGERVLRMNGIKVIKENETYFIEKYVSKQESILKKKPGQGLKVQYQRSQTLTDPRYLLTLLGYSTKQKEYYEYPNLQCYKCPAYGIEVVMYEDWGNCQYVMIEAVNNYEGFNPVMMILVDKLRELITEESYNQFDPYTLRPKALKHGRRPDL